MSRHRGEVTGELVGLFAHHAAALEVAENAIEQLRVPQQIERGFAFVIADRDLRRLRFKRLADRRVLQFFELAAARARYRAG